MGLVDLRVGTLAREVLELAWPALTLIAIAHIVLVRHCLRSGRPEPAWMALAAAAAIGSILALALWLQLSFARMTGAELAWWLYPIEPWLASAAVALGLLTLPRVRRSGRAIFMLTTVAGLSTSLATALLVYRLPLPEAIVRRVPTLAIGLVSGMMGFTIVSPLWLSVLRWGRQERLSRDA